jgi:hypothetical protein
MEEMPEIIEYIQNPNGIEAQEEKQRETGIEGTNISSVRIRPDGRWINQDPDFIVFTEVHHEHGHNCGTCKCSFCGEPSVFNKKKLENKSNGKIAGHRYCLDCLGVELKKHF